MALVNCPECQNSVSADAAICPHCGKRLKRSNAGLFVKLSVLLALLVAGAILLNWLLTTDAVEGQEFRRLLGIG